MTVDQANALIRKYLSAGVAMVLVLVGPATAPSGDPAPTTDDGRTAAATHGWGTPDREDDFTEGLGGWGLYDGPGHAGEGTRSPDAASVADGVLTLNGDADGTTAGMAWGHGKGQKYGREDNQQLHGRVEIDGVTTYVDVLPPGPMYLSIQLDWFPQKRDGAVRPSQMQVDWVRQYPIEDDRPSQPPHSAASIP